MPISHEPRINSSQLQRLVRAIFQRCGMTESHAMLLADSLVFADRRGVHSHGTMRVPEYVQKLTMGGVNPLGEPHTVQDNGICLVVDGGNSMGQIGAHYAMEQAIARARESGMAAAAVRGSNHCGSLAYFAIQAPPEGMIGIATTNALPTMAPWGGAEPILGINPVAIAIPALNELPIVYDAAFSASSHGKIRIYQQRGDALPEGWALDRDGQPTTDPAAAILGLLMPIGGFKGTALATIMGILSSLLSGASFGTELGNMTDGPRPGQDGHFVLALRISAFVDLDVFRSRVDRIIQEIHACRRAPGVAQIFAPGEPEYLSEIANERDGIPLTAATLDGLRRTAAELDLVTDALS
ncbi:MAG TPA: Ldh family oxidoreductase [Chloroflexota bacterium]|nr:Ldh family oxidoreductase [Chloroflexota bacterium]